MLMMMMILMRYAAAMNNNIPIKTKIALTNSWIDFSFFYLFNDDVLNELLIIIDCCIADEMRFINMLGKILL